MLSQDVARDLHNVHLIITDGGLIVHGDTPVLEGQSLKHVSVTRLGAPGPAIHVIATSDTSVAPPVNQRSVRWTWSDIHVCESTGEGVVFEGAFLGTAHGLWVRNCQGDGIVHRLGTVNSNGIGSNAISIFGGEVVNCERGIYSEYANGSSYYGYTVEGNRSFGIELGTENHAFSFDGGFFENNSLNLATGAGFDIQSLGGSVATSITGNYFTDSNPNHLRSINFGPNEHWSLEHNSFNFYGANNPITGTPTVSQGNIAQRIGSPDFLF